MTNKQLPVIFRKYPVESPLGDIVALFPTMPAETVGNDIVFVKCYEFDGKFIQQGTAYPQGLIRITKPATPEEYKKLMTELHKIGYKNLKVCKRLLYKHLEKAKGTAKEYK